MANGHGLSHMGEVMLALKGACLMCKRCVFDVARDRPPLVKNLSATDKSTMVQDIYTKQLLRYVTEFGKTCIVHTSDFCHSRIHKI